MINKDIEIFGVTDGFTEEDIDHIVKNYDPKIHEAPNVIGHPKTDDPAYGWIQSLKKIGQKIFANTDIAPDLWEKIKNGEYKKRSVRIYRNLIHEGKSLGKYLGHVGWLGAMPPRKKGMADVDVFSQDEEIEYDDYSKEIEVEKNKETLMENFTQVQVDQLIAATKTELQNDFAEQLKVKTKELEDKIISLEKDNSDFAETIEAKDEEIKDLNKKTTEQDAADFAEQLIKDEKLLPKEKDSIVELLTDPDLSEDYVEKLKKSYTDREKIIEFGEDGDAGKKPPGEKEKENKKIQEENDFSDEDMELADVNSMSLAKIKKEDKK